MESININVPNTKKIEAINNLSQAINNLSKVLVNDYVKVNISDCTFTQLQSNEQPSINIEPAIDDFETNEIAFDKGEIGN